MPIASQWVFLGGGALAMLVACFVAWRKEHGIANMRDAYLRLTRIADEGEKRLAAYDSIEPGQTLPALASTAELQDWHRDTLATLENSYPDYRTHFADIGSFESRGLSATREQAATLLNRIRGLMGMIKPVTNV